jgi:aryl-alcohol dehydrogenase-like predicted oxidoreductase
MTSLAAKDDRAGVSTIGCGSSMRYGSLCGIQKPVSRLILGTGSLRDMDLVHSVLDDAYSMGYNTFDTARIYNEGANEKALGSWIQRRQVRDSVVIITKGGHPGPRWRSRLRRADLIDDISASVEALVSTIDLFLLHRDDPSVPVGEIVETLNEMVAQQKIAAFGASNWSARRIDEAQRFAGQNGLRGFCASSPHVSLANWVHAPWPGCVSLAGPPRRDEKQWYLERQFPVLAWSPLAGGFLTASGDLGRTTDYPSYNSAENVEKRIRAATIGIFSVVSSTRMDHLQNNIAALDITLSPRERCWLELEPDGQLIGEFSATS